VKRHTEGHFIDYRNTRGADNYRQYQPAFHYEKQPRTILRLMSWAGRIDQPDQGITNSILKWKKSTFKLGLPFNPMRRARLEVSTTHESSRGDEQIKSSAGRRMDSYMLGWRSGRAWSACRRSSTTRTSGPGFIKDCTTWPQRSSDYHRQQTVANPWSTSSVTGVPSHRWWSTVNLIKHSNKQSAQFGFNELFKIHFNLQISSLFKTLK